MMADISTIVDVQDMVCAQALPVVANAFKQLPPGGAVEVRFNAEDVKEDLLAWARQGGHVMEELGPNRLRISRRKG